LIDIGIRFTAQEALFLVDISATFIEKQADTVLVTEPAHSVLPSGKGLGELVEDI
jgi:hypothetical protein